VVQLAIQASEFEHSRSVGRAPSGHGQQARQHRARAAQGELEAEFAQDLRITRGDGEHFSGGRTPTELQPSRARAKRHEVVLLCCRPLLCLTRHTLSCLLAFYTVNKELISQNKTKVIARECSKETNFFLL
jgi:hypothetical protein